jgi:hypothetical protein
MKITAVQECNYPLAPELHGRLLAHLDIVASAIEGNYVRPHHMESLREMYRLINALNPVLYYREVAAQQVEIEEVA